MYGHDELHSVPKSIPIRVISGDIEHDICTAVVVGILLLELV